MSRNWEVVQVKALVIPAKAASDVAKAGIHSDRFRIKSGMTTVFLAVLSLSFFWPVWLQGKLPIPADALVGLYHPFRDYFSDKFPQGVPYKNFILTDPVLQQYPWKWLAIEGWKEIFSGIFKGPVLPATPAGGPRQGWTLSYLQENPYNFSGAPLLANIQAGVFYPLNLIFFLGEFSQMWTVYIILQPILASLFMFWWLKNSGIKHIGAIFGGLVWAFSSFNLAWMEWGNIGHVGLWLPLALLAIDKIVKRKKDIVIPCLTRNLSRINSGTSYRFPLKAGMTALFWHVLLQFSLVASLLAGHWQITLYLLAAVAVYIILVKMKRPGLAEARPGLNKSSVFLVHCFLFVILTSFQWVPAWRFIRESNRQVEQENVLTREGFFIRPRQLVQLISPDFFGNPATGNYRGEWNYSEQVIYVGLIPLIFSILSIVNLVIPGLTRNLFKYSYRSRIKSGMTGGKIEIFAVSIIFFGLIFAVRNPIAEIPYKLNIPIWSDLQPTRLSYLITFGLSILAAVGLENLRRFLDFGTSRRPFARNDRKLMVIIGGLGTVFLALLIYSSKLDAADRVVSQRNLILPMLILGLFGVAAVTAWIFRRLPRPPTLRRGPRPPAIAWRRSNWRAGNDGVVFLFSVFCFLFSVFDLFRFGWKFTPFSPPEYLYPVTPAIKFLQENMGPGDKYMALDRRILPPNANIMYKLESIEGYDPIYSRTYALLITRMETGELRDVPANFGRIIRPGNFGSPLAGELGVKYVLALNEIQDEKLTKVFQEKDTRIYSLYLGRL